MNPVFKHNEKMGALSPQLKSGLFVHGNKIIQRLSYSHIELLLGINDPLKRTFYETKCIKGTWSVRELKRQINSQYFERSGLSNNPEKLAKLVQQKTKPQKATDIINKNTTINNYEAFGHAFFLIHLMLENLIAVQKS